MLGQSDGEMVTWGDFVRLLLAVVLGAGIGIERQWRHTRSVLRMNLLVSLGAAIFVMLSVMMPGDASPAGTMLGQSDGERVTLLDFVIRLLLAVVLGAGIGIERQWRHTRSVLRTNVLVSLGAAIFVMLSVMMPGDASPTRIAAQIVSGIGFLGGGVIIYQKGSVRGLNTAATLWCAAAVGSVLGAGFLLHAYVGTLAVIGTNLLLRPIVEWFQQLDKQSITHTKPEVRYCCRLICLAENEAAARAVLLEPTVSRQLMLHEILSKSTGSNDLTNLFQVEIKAEYVSDGRNDALMDELVMRLKSRVRVTVIQWEIVAEDTD